MLLSCVLRLRALGPVDLPVTNGYEASAAFRRLLGTIDAGLPGWLHGVRPKPFTVSPVLGPGEWSVPTEGPRPTRRRVTADEGDELEWRWTVFGGRIEFADAVLRRLRRPFDVSIRSCRPGPAARLRCVGVTWHRAEHDWAWRTTYERLAAVWLSRTSCVSSVDLDFATPATFRAHGTSWPVPLPAWLLGSAARSWEAYAPPHLRRLAHPFRFPGPAGTALQIASYTLAAERVELGATRRVAPLIYHAFAGRVNVDATPLRGSTDLLRAFNLLASYLLFCGAGSATAFGLGQVKRFTSTGGAPPPRP